MQSDASRSEPANCHFISRFLTAPWEFGERQLHFVDVEAQTLSHHSSRNLFALRGLNTKQTEERLNEFVETPVARYREESAGGSPPDEIPWDVHRALFLIVLLQLPRAVEGFLGKSGLTLDDVFRCTEAELDGLVHHYENSRQLVVLTTPNDSLFYPSSGVFFLPVKSDAALLPYENCLGVPLDLNLVAVTAPRDADLDILLKRTSQPGWYSCRSAAIDGLATKVVVPPIVVERAPDKDQLVAHVLDCQRLNRSLVENIERTHSLLENARSIAGLD